MGLVAGRVCCAPIVIICPRGVDLCDLLVRCAHRQGATNCGKEHCSFVGVAGVTGKVLFKAHLGAIGASHSRQQDAESLVRESHGVLGLRQDFNLFEDLLDLALIGKRSPQRDPRSEMSLVNFESLQILQFGLVVLPDLRKSESKRISCLSIGGIEVYRMSKEGHGLAKAML
jgi:hypothetical protein